MKRDNPFTLTFGKQPSRYIERYENTDTIVDVFDAENPVSQTYLIEGIRGSGKTVLMTSITKELLKSESWINVDLNATQNLIDDFAMRLTDEVKKIPNFIDKGFSINLAGFGVSVGKDETKRDSVSIIEVLLNYIKKKNKKVLITIDEVVNDSSMRVFASQFQIFLRKDYPIFLLMTGLYENINAIQNDPSLTFLLRTPKIYLEPLSRAQIVIQYQDIFGISTEESKELAQITKGYAFAFQALGKLYWEYRDELNLEDILIKLDSMLDDYVYKKIWAALSKQDKKIVLAIGENDKIKIKDLCNKIDMKITVLSKYRERLINKGIIYAPEHGYISFALPRFYNVVSLYE